MARLTLELEGLAGADFTPAQVPQYNPVELRQRKWQWDRVVKACHPINCGYQQTCSFNLYVKDGVVLREEQAALYPAPNNPLVPDFNPRGCQKGVCYAQRMYDPTRLKYPMKRVGERGEGKWKRISWDEALAEVADAVIDTLLTDGPGAVVRGGGTQVQNGTAEATSGDAFLIALGSPLSSQTSEIGDEHQGCGVTFGKGIIADSADNWFYADMILMWGGNPAYTNIANYHFISEARYHGTRTVVISPDYNPSAMHADVWVPVKIGTDTALALAMAQVVIKEGLFKADFVREQTDLPLLVVEATGKFLREKDLKRGGREDIFYLYDQAAGRVVEAPRKSLSLDGLQPALEGTYEVETLQGRVAATPVMERLRKLLDEQYTPEQASQITGVPARQIESLAREIAAARGIVNIGTYNWGKFYHGDLIERAIILVWVLCGHLGHKGASYNAFSMLGLDTALGGLEKRGDQVILSAAGADPRFAQWREDGFTDEMILYEYVYDAFAQGAVVSTGLMYYLHGGLMELSQKFNSWDPYLKRPLGDYVKESFAKGWQYPAPAPGKEPKVLFIWGGNVIKRVRGTNIVLQNLLPKLRLLVTIDWRWTSSALYSDIILPVCSWYERHTLLLMAQSQPAFAHLVNKATEPMGESRSDWQVFVLLARKIEQRARERGLSGYLDTKGLERRFAGLEDKITFGGLYAEDDEEGIARDAFLNASNVEHLDWEEFKERGIAQYTGLGTAMRSIGNACDLVPGEPVVPLTRHTDKKEPWPTLTRRAQFYIDHELYMELGEEFPVYKECPRAGGDYPLRVTGGHARWSIHSMWADDVLLLQLQRGEPGLFMSAEDARARGIQDGDKVEVHNDIDRFRVEAIVSPAVRPGQVMIYHHWENYQFKNWQHFKNVMPSPLNPIEMAGGYFHLRPVSLGNHPGLNDRETRVEVRRVNDE